MFSSLQQSSTRFEQLSRRINVVIAFLAVTVFVSLILEYGFYFPQSTVSFFESVDMAVLLCFMAAQGSKLLLSPRRAEYVRERRIEYSLTLLLMLSLIPLLLMPDLFSEIAARWQFRGLTSLVVLLAQIVIVLNLLFGAVRFSRKITDLQLQPARLFIASFVLVILTGTAGLLLPRATTGGITFVDALFTSTSAVCVTGLSSVDTATTFTTLGKVIIMLLIQVGGLGLMTFTTFFTLFSGRLSIKERVIMQDFLSSENLGQIRHTLFQIIGVTLVIEAAGALLLFFSWGDAYFPSVQSKVFSSIFHAVSAFCNAGFSLFSDNLAGPALVLNVPVNLTIAGLIILGGLGFITIVNTVSARPWGGMHGRLRHRLTTHTRVVLVSTAALLVLGTVSFYVLEYHNTLSRFDWDEKLLVSFFTSVTPRTAGFNTIDFGSVAVPGTFMVILLMFIGASPGSTGGGIKTTTASLVVLSGLNYVRGKDKVEIGNRCVPQANVDRASTVLFFGLVHVALAVFLVSFFEPFPILDVIFECVSAMGTVGLSRGITFGLSDPSKIILVFTMLIGRVGALTLMMAITRRAVLNRFDFPTEQVVVG